MFDRLNLKAYFIDIKDCYTHLLEQVTSLVHILSDLMATSSGYGLILFKRTKQS